MIQLSKFFRILQRYPSLLQTYEKFTASQTQIVNRSLSLKHQKHLANTCYTFKRVRCGIQELYQSQQQIQNVFKYFDSKGFELQYKNGQIGLMRELKKSTNLDLSNHNFSIAGESDKQNKVPAQMKDQQFYKLRVKVITIPVQKRDLPCFRDTLYFSQLKDAHKYLTIPGVHPTTPQFMKDIMWRNLQQIKLDRKNPLGLPIHAPPMYMQIFFRKMWLKLRVQLNQITIQEFGADFFGQKSQQILMQSPKNSSRMSKQSLDQRIQELTFKFIKQQLRFNQDFILMLHRLAYVGGHAKQIGFLMDFFQLLILWKQELLKVGNNGMRLF